MTTGSPDPSAAIALQGVRVWVTRPPAQAGKWQQLLQSEGAQTAIVPLMTIEPITSNAHQQTIKHQILALAEYQHLIFVSQNAVHYGLEWIDRYWPQLPVRVHFYAVGSATAKGLIEYGCPVRAAGHTMNSEALLALPELQQVAGDKVLIFRGQGGRPTLAEVLQQRGAEVSYCELYRRHFPKREAEFALQQLWPLSAGDVVALHSGEALENWLQVLEGLAPELAEACRRVPVLVPGERVAEQARSRCGGEVIVAENATDAVMLAALRHWNNR